MVNRFGSRRWRLAPVSILGTLVLIGALIGIAQSAQPRLQPETSSATEHGLAATTTDSTATTSNSEVSATTTPAPLAASNFFVEPCAAIVGSPPLTSNLDLRPFLLTSAQLSAGAVIDGPHQTSTTPAEPMTFASVPTTSPAAYENISLSQTTTPGGGAGRGLSEVIGDVASASFASQLLSMLNADLAGPSCGSNGKPDMVPLPGTNPPVIAAVSGGQARSGSVSGARLFAAKGSRLLCLTWGSSSTYNGFGHFGSAKFSAQAPTLARRIRNGSGPEDCLGSHPRRLRPDQPDPECHASVPVVHVEGSSPSRLAPIKTERRWVVQRLPGWAGVPGAGPNGCPRHPTRAKRSPNSGRSGRASAPVSHRSGIALRA